MIVYVIGLHQRFHLSSSRKVSTSGKNGLPGVNPVGKPDASKVAPPPPPVGKPNVPKGNSSKAVIGGAAVVGAFLVAYQTGYLDKYLEKETQKLSETAKSDAVTEKPEEAHHLNVAHGIEDSTGNSSSMDGKVETQPEVPHSEASGGIQTDRVVQPESDVTPDRYTYISSNQEETPQESAIDRAEKSLPISSDDNSTSEEDSRTKSDTSPVIISEAENVRLEAVPKPGDSIVVSAQASSVHRESEIESASPKDPATEKAPEVLNFP